MQEITSQEEFKYLPDKRPDEKVYYLLRRHWMAMTNHFLLLVFEGLIPLGVYLYVQYFGGYAFILGEVVTTIAILFASGYYMFIWLFFFHHWIDYYLDIWVVTDQRIVNVVQSGLFSRRISELNIIQVQDVSSFVKGSLATFFDYGQIHIQTAGEKPRFVFEQIPHPRKVAIKIVELHDAEARKYPLPLQADIQDDKKPEPEPPRIISSPTHENK